METPERHRELLEMAVEAVPALLSYIDRDLRYRFNNRAYEVWFGHPRQEVYGRTMEEVLGSAAFAEVRPHAEAAVRGEHVRYERRVPYRTGGTRWIDAEYIPDVAPDGHVRGFFALVHDISQRKEAELARLARETEFRTIFDLAGSGKAQADPTTGRFVRVNRKFCEITGYSQDELLGMSYTDLTHPEDRQTEALLVGPVLAGEIDEWDLEKRYVRKDGQVLWVQVTGALLRDTEGRPYRTVATIHDITAQKQLMAHLQESSRQKDRFLGVLAHELRNPLAAVSGALQVAERHPERLSDLLQALRRNVGFLERIVDDLLDISRISGGKVRLVARPMDLVDVLHESARDVEDLVAGRGHRLRLDLPPAPLPLEGDPARLRQVFGNLLRNAVDFMDDAGAIEVRVHRVGGDYVVDVQDSGIGIEPDLMDRVQELFGRGEHQGASRGGLGIGLALSRQLVELHGGTLTATSPGRGQGSTFTVTLPGPLQVLAPTPAPPAQAPTELSGLRILLIDDNEDAVTSLAFLLEIGGAETRTAGDGPQGLALFDEWAPDAVLLDLGLPGMSGHEVARELRSRGFAGPLVVISGYGHEEDRRRSAEAGVDLHLVKPADLRRIQEYLAGTRAAR